MAAPKKPAIIRELEGNRSRRKIPVEPKGIGAAKVPEHLAEEEAALYEITMRSMPVGLLTGSDEGAIERYAVAWARFRQCQRTLAKEGLLVENKTKGWHAHPLVLVQQKAAEVMHRAGELLGLSPLARSRLVAGNDKGDEDPLELLLDGRKDGAYYVPGPREKQDG